MPTSYPKEFRRDVIAVARQGDQSKAQIGSAVLKRNGAATRYRILDEGQIDEAVRFYESGQSLARISEKLGVSARTVRSRLLEREVAMRDSHGRFNWTNPGDDTPRGSRDSGATTSTKRPALTLPASPRPAGAKTCRRFNVTAPNGSIANCAALPNGKRAPAKEPKEHHGGKDRVLATFDYPED